MHSSRQVEIFYHVPNLCLVNGEQSFESQELCYLRNLTIYCLKYKQIKDILKGSLRFNQSQLEAEENEEITIADNHYCSNNRGEGAEGESKKLLNTDREMLVTMRTEECLEQGLLAVVGPEPGHLEVSDGSRAGVSWDIGIIIADTRAGVLDNVENCP
eukprot:g47454.t1